MVTFVVIVSWPIGSDRGLLLSCRDSVLNGWSVGVPLFVAVIVEISVVTLVRCRMLW